MWVLKVGFGGGELGEMEAQGDMGDIVGEMDER